MLQLIKITAENYFNNHCHVFRSQHSQWNANRVQSLKRTYEKTGRTFSTRITRNEGNSKYIMKLSVKHTTRINSVFVAPGLRKWEICLSWELLPDKLRISLLLRSLLFIVQWRRRIVLDLILTTSLLRISWLKSTNFVYSLMLLYITNFKKELLSVLEDNALANSVLQYQRHYLLYFPLYQTISKRLIAEIEVPLVGVR